MQSEKSIDFELKSASCLNQFWFLFGNVPIYGAQFLPHKVKIAVTVPTDNSVDLFTNDIGIVVISDDSGEPHGFNLYVGGGMGRRNRMETTFPRLSEPCYLSLFNNNNSLSYPCALMEWERLPMCPYGRNNMLQWNGNIYSCAPVEETSFSSFKFCREK